MKPNARKYAIDLSSAMLVYTVALVISLRLWVPLAVMRFFRTIDELQQRIQLEALTFAFAGSAVVTFSYGFLQNAGFPPLNWTLVWPVMTALWVIGLVIAQRRYR